VPYNWTKVLREGYYELRMRRATVPALSLATR